jgi:hypothetical protein
MYELGAAFIRNVERVAGDAQGFIDAVNWSGGTWYLPLPAGALRQGRGNPGKDTRLFGGQPSAPEAVI